MRLEPQLFSGQNTDDTNITKKVYNGSHKDVFCRPQTLSYTNFILYIWPNVPASG
jgi:hypothetical protein